MGRDFFLFLVFIEKRTSLLENLNELFLVQLENIRIQVLL